MAMANVKVLLFSLGCSLSEALSGSCYARKVREKLLEQKLTSRIERKREHSQTNNVNNNNLFIVNKKLSTSSL